MLSQKKSPEFQEIFFVLNSLFLFDNNGLVNYNFYQNG